MKNMMQPEKKEIQKKLFPRAYIVTNQIIFQPLKKSRFLNWIVLILLSACFGLFTWFQTNLINEASQLSEIIR